MVRLTGSGPFPPSKYVREFAEAVNDKDAERLTELLNRQTNKVIEEHREMIEAIIEVNSDSGGHDDMAHACEECADLIQASENLLHMMAMLCGTTPDAVKVYVKMKCLARDKGFYG